MTNKIRSRQKNVVSGKGTIKRRGSGLNSNKPAETEERSSILKKGLSILTDGIEDIAEKVGDIFDNDDKK